MQSKGKRFTNKKNTQKWGEYGGFLMGKCQNTTANTNGGYVLSAAKSPTETEQAKKNN